MEAVPSSLYRCRREFRLRAERRDSGQQADFTDEQVTSDVHRSKAGVRKSSEGKLQLNRTVLSQTKTAPGSARNASRSHGPHQSYSLIWELPWASAQKALHIVVKEGHAGLYILA